MSDKVFRFLEEAAAKNDEFDDKTHENIANSIYEVISNNPCKGITIGLEGSWGAGKSTVVSILKEKIHNNPEIKVFYFDAWSHEGDPLRRVFLESFVLQLLPDNLQLQEIVNKITNRKKTANILTKKNTTILGTILAISTLLVPLGITLTNAFIKNCDLYLQISAEIYWPIVFTLMLTISPAFVLLGNLFYLTIRKIFSRKKFKVFDSDRWMFLQSDSSETTKQEISEDEERSSIEFEHYFDQILHILFNTCKSKKLLLIIDNLDRINSEDALKIWSTLQTFLQDRNPSGNCRSNYDKVWILVPYDPEGLKKIWHRDDHSIAQSFFDKSFQLRIEVPSMILSGWEAFCRRCIDFSFQGWADKDKEQVISVLKYTRKGVTDAPSPRQIKTYVNQVGFLSVNSNEGISIETISYYVILKYLQFTTNSSLESQLLNGTIPGLEHQRTFPDTIISELCGLIYGVSPAKGVQILIEPKIEDSLLSSNAELLKMLIDLHSSAFWTIFDLHIQKINDTIKLLKYTKTVWEFLYHDNQKYFTHFIRKLITFYSNNLNTLEFPSDDEKASEIIALLSILENNNVLLQSITESLMSSLENLLIDPKNDFSIFSKNLSLIKSKTDYPSKISTFNDISIESWFQWITVSDEISNKLIKPSDQIIDTVVKQLSFEKEIEPKLKSFISFLRSHGFNNFSAIVNAVITNLKTTGTRPNPPVTNATLIEIVTELSFNYQKEILPLLTDPKVYILCNSPQTVNHLAILLGNIYRSKMSEISINHVENSVTVYNQAKSFWKKSDINNAKLVWKYAKMFNSFSFIWDISTDKTNLLITDIIQLAINEKNKDFFSTENNLSTIAYCLYYFQKDDETIKNICFFLLENSDINLTIKSLEDVLNHLEPLIVLLTHTENMQLHSIAGNKLLEITQESWIEGLTNDSKLLDLLAQILKKLKDFKLKNEYAYALEHFITSIIQKTKTLSSRQIAEINLFFTPLSPEFLVYVSKQIGKVIAQNNFVIDQDLFNLLSPYISFKNILKTNSANFENALDYLSKNCTSYFVDMVCRVIKDNKNASYQSPPQYQAILTEPLNTLLHSSDESKLGNIKYLMDFFQIESEDRKVEPEPENNQH